MSPLPDGRTNSVQCTAGWEISPCDARACLGIKHNLLWYQYRVEISSRQPKVLARCTQPRLHTFYTNLWRCSDYANNWSSEVLALVYAGLSKIIQQRNTFIQTQASPRYCLFFILSFFQTRADCLISRVRLIKTLPPLFLRGLKMRRKYLY